MDAENVVIYTIVHTAVDSDWGSFLSPQAEGSYLSLEKARSELWRLVAEEKERLDDRYDMEESGDDFWETYQNGYSTACSSRFDILSSEIVARDGENVL